MKNSTELLDLAFREVEEAIKSNTSEVKIILEESFKGDVNAVKEVGRELEIKKITELLREKCDKQNLNVKSVVATEYSATGIRYERGCSLYETNKLVWTLTLIPQTINDSTKS